MSGKLNLKFRTNPQVILYRLLDSASKWDYFVSYHVLDWLKQDFELTEEQKSLLEEFKNLRVKITIPDDPEHDPWNAQIELLDWAYANFPESKYSYLKPFVDEFSAWVGKNGRTIKETVKRNFPEVENRMKVLEEMAGHLDLTEVIGKLDKIFTNNKQILKEMPAYILWSPLIGKRQGGANGEGICAEVNSVDDENTNFRSSISMIVHEYLHKRIAPNGSFSDWTELNGLNQKYPHINQGADLFFYFCEELVIYSVCDVILFKRDPIKIAETQRKIEAERGIDEKYSYLWDRVNEFYPIMQDFLNDKATPEETKQRIIRFAVELARN